MVAPLASGEHLAAQAASLTRGIAQRFRRPGLVRYVLSRAPLRRRREHRGFSLDFGSPPCESRKELVVTAAIPYRVREGEPLH